MKTQTTHSVQLRTGHLQVSVNKARIPLKRLLGFSSRINSKRGFLFISKVLGKHYPVKPKVMAWSYRALARQILGREALASPSLWIGMAETATGLGYGVYAAARPLLDQALFMQTTRYHLSGAERLDFVETHSHATDFFLYWPEQADKRQLFLQAKQLILIDDEISTGATFSRLISAYRNINPHLQKVIIASLVNFASAEHRQQVELAAGIPVQWLSLLQGQWQFTEGDIDPRLLTDDNIKVVGNGACKRQILAWPGRLGIAQTIAFSQHSLSTLQSYLEPTVNDSRPILVLGTGECNPPAFVLGRALEQQGYPVIVQATTRSPIFVEKDISAQLRFSDNYQDGIDNFLYNLKPDAYRQIIFCHETPLTTSNETDKLDFIGLIKQVNGISAQYIDQGDGYAQLSICRP